MGQKLTEGLTVEDGNDHLNEICTAAKEFLSLPKEGAKAGLTNARVIPSSLKFFAEEERWTHPFEVLWCDVKPQFWVRRDFDKKLVLMLKFIPFPVDGNYSFDIEYIESEPVPCVDGGKCEIYELGHGIIRFEFTV